MRIVTLTILAGVLSIGVGLAIGGPAAHAQGPIGSLGGYGGLMTEPGSRIGNSGSAVLYASRFGGLVPYYGKWEANSGQSVRPGQTLCVADWPEVIPANT